ncbi:hypothetical protein BaRGS_00004259 [Batillaria attramentaria]|uniref:GTPase-activating protein and VPS9 domain-containing protein 1 n=1 Tax=Batillaria attramentaria TaxID=370345 RepID=A0ABD0LZF4_9CAEN
MSLMSDLSELSQHLQQERLFVSTEREQLQRLYENVRQTSERLLHVAWIGRHQKSILKTCVSRGNDAKAVDVCGQSNELENTSFVDSYKHFSHHDSKYGDLLKFLWENPALVGHCIYEGEKAGLSGMEQVITTITASIYGGCMFREDEVAVLQILKLMTEVQLANDDNPRRMLRRGSCAFSLLYRQLCDSLFSARLFLTAALHDPIMRLLMEDEWFYDIDPDKALVRFPAKERQKRFGDPGTDEYRTKQNNYRNFIVDKLVQLATRFISSIKANLHCFPPALAWVVSQVFSSLTQAGRVDQAEVRASCADLVFALFICPAICDPEPYGITSDIPISHIARHNLMQIAQIIQVLAISRWEEIDVKVKDLYGRFEKGCMSTVLDSFLEGPWDDALISSGLTPPNLPMRSTMLMTPAEVKDLVVFLRQTNSILDDKLPGRKQLEGLLATLPQEIPSSPADSVCSASPASSMYMDPLLGVSATGSGSSAPDTPGSQRKLFKGKSTLKKKPSGTNLPQMMEDTGGNGGDKEKPSVPEDVLVITVVPPADCPGMIPEKKVLAWEYENRRRKVKYPPALSDAIPVAGAEIQEKRTRFSLSHDQESIGNTSDCPEALSEAASSHSVDENELDNFSDMMSANVSGRGSPSISGRDTPLSQAGSVEENRGPAAELPVPVPETVQKQNRVDVTDRFGKFDLERDEIKSTVSDTWSTDVLASDSEPPDQNQLDRLEEVAEEIIRPFMLGTRDQEPVSEISETASDAWSTDVLASDTDEKNSERLKELEDQDEVSSIVDRDEGDNSVGNEDLAGDDVEAMGAVGGAVAGPVADDIADFGEVFHSTSDSPKPARDEVLELPKRPSSGNPQPPFQTPQSLHPPQFHRSKQSGSEPQHVDSGNPLIEITEALKSPSPTTETAEPLVDVDQAEPLTLAEQQNTRISESRLSAALSLFDPFASEGEGDVPLSSNANNNRSVETLKDTFGVSSGAGDNLANVSSRSVDSAIELLCEDDSAFKDPFVPKVNGGVVNMVSEKDRGEDEEGSQRRSGAAGTVASLQRDAPDNVSLRSDDKDFQEGEDSDRGSKKGGSGFFRTFRDKLHKGMKRKTKQDKDFAAGEGQEDSGRSTRAAGEGEGSDTGSNKVETSDDILAKYRTPKKGAVSKLGQGAGENLDGARDSALSQNREEEEKLAPAQVEENTPFLDPSNLEACFAFQDAKRKLRLVLSMCEIQPGFCQVQSHSPRQGSGSPREHELVYLLKAQLAEAINLQNKELITRLHEVIRCIKLFDYDGCKKLLKSLREEYRNRAAYISYLVRCRQGLLSGLSHLQKMLNRVERDKEIISKHLINVCVRLFIERHERQVILFISQFQKLAMSDEKTDLVDQFLQYMYQEMLQDNLWKAASEVQLEDGRASIERLLMSRIYTHAMFPNGDGDILRDQLIQQHIKKLSAIITPTHKDLRIPRVYHFECPWPAAQRDIFMINAYKTPKDKLKCVLRCSQTIMNLLSMANEKSVPAADDFMPVLIFVLIKANPPCLLSTIQYVESFYDNRLQGEEQYWWLQFSSAVEYIKTMDYSE